MFMPICNFCGERFAISNTQIKQGEERRGKGNGVEVWCPHCNAYMILYPED